MKIFYTSKVEKQLTGLPKGELKKIFSKIEKLSDESGAGKPLKGEFDGLYSLRAWPYRIIYKVEEGALVICLLLVMVAV